MSAFDPSLRLRLAMIVWAGAMLFSAPDPARAQAPSAPATQPPAPATQPPVPENRPPAAQPAPAPPAAGMAPPAAPQPAPSEAPAGSDAAKKPPGTPAVVIDGASADTLLGKPVESADGEDMGRIIDVIVDRNGTMRAAIIDFGGFLGVGSRKIAVDWRVLHFAKDNMQRVVAELSRDQLRVAPVYKAGEPVVVVGRADAAPPAPASPPASPPIAPAAAAGPTAGTSTSPPAPTAPAPATTNSAPATPANAPPASPTNAPPPPAAPSAPAPNP